ncbi:MAG TPA: 4-alpha-glucanotransferase [Acidobacteriaceae bacterium]|nr:4-alpha-glucanotransferase [Acidobacteriaceae bacterium]
MALERSSGLLLHISSLPSYGGIGDLGPAAYEFADFLKAAKQRLWQVLPLSPTGFGNSPYAALSAFAGNPLLISLEKLVEAGWLTREQIQGLPGHEGNVGFEEVEQRKWPLLVEAARQFLSHHDDEQWARFHRFREENAFWLTDYALYSVLREQFSSGYWLSWPKEFAHRDSAALIRLQQENRDRLEVEQAIQFAFDEQWKALRAYCADREIRFIGDVAIFVNFDSADVWTHPDIFELKKDLTPIRVAGVPPDYFSATGQRWGNPIYRWNVLQSRGFDWWVDRIRRTRALYDVIRLDHFRGFEAFWAIPAEDETAIHGEWVKAPGAALFAALQEKLGHLPLIAEDLGLITREVDALRDQFGLPGMRVLQFAFSDRAAHNYLPHRYVTNTVVYTGTHDNDTTLGWWQNGATEAERHSVYIYLNPAPNDVVWTMIRAASASVADVCIFPVQDVLALGSEARMNTPALPENNWTWRMAPGALGPGQAKGLAQLAEATDRDGWVEPAKT